MRRVNGRRVVRRAVSDGVRGVGRATNARRHQEEAIARTVMTAIAGPASGVAVLLAIMLSVFGALNGNLLAKPRVAYAMARGMPDFTGRLSADDVEKIKAFIQGTADAIRPKAK